MLEVEDLHVKVGGRKVLHGVSMCVAPGEIVALLGPNGSGKSTLLHAIMGDPRYKVISGSISLDGRDITGLPPDERAKLGLFLAFQSPPEIPGVTLASLLLRASGRERDAAAFSDLASLASRVHLDPSHLSRTVNVGFSGGERKRSELLQGLFLNRKYLLLDEIDSGVDAEGLKTVAKILDDLRNSGRGLVLISHNPNILDYLGVNRVLIMRDGRIVRSGGPDILHREGF
ncbi:MAG TPA: Fe-S cluster assembly ATPase SufC [Candidatus Atribacteria bacterium]|nr:Fe-S cluster assembly ATPase SufC [Candidatus Atribacteria bacterium]